MRNAYIKFRTADDASRGFDVLVAHGSISRLSNDIYCIPWDSLAVLDARAVAYGFASEDDLTSAQPLWDFSCAYAR